MSVCLKQLKLCEIPCFKRKSTSTTTIVTQRVKIQNTLQRSSCGLEHTDKETPWSLSPPLSSSESARRSHLVRSFQESLNKKHEGLPSMDSGNTVTDRKDNGRLSLLAALKKRRAYVRHHSVQYNQESEQYTGNDEDNLTVNKIGKENMNVGLRRNTVCSTTGGTFKSIRTRGLMELRKSNRNCNVDQKKQLNPAKSKSTEDPVVGLMNFRKLTLNDNMRKIVEREQIQLKSDKCMFQHRSNESKVESKQLAKIITPQESDINMYNNNRRMNKWSVLESTKIMTALFFDDLPIMLEKAINIQFTTDNIPTEHNHANDKANEKGIPYYNCLSVISLPRSPPDEQPLGEFHLNHERIFRYLFTQDLKVTSYYQENFLERHGLTESVRSTLCDWMIKVQQYLKLRTESLHLAVNLVDQYTWRQITLCPSDYQLLGITAIFIAVKFIERFPPATKTLCYLTENSYSPKQVLDFEMKMLQVLDFCINIPLPHHFLDRAIVACNDLTVTGKAKIELACRYLFELSLTELSAAGVLATVKCAAGVYLTRELIRLEYENGKSKTNDIQINSNDSIRLSVTFETWPEALGRSLGHESSNVLLPMVLIYVQNIVRLLPNSNMNKESYEAAFHKFSNRGYGRIAQSSLLLDADYDYIVKEISRKMTSSSN
ncbi:G2/mitotic-specific cyclin-B1 isoform 1 [Schistosoma japonicum]|uniref:G2/mitotic-specific cyclin-B1 isoform 1 n=1 Tax=Schistosoma japonicum TaxID=6182 RepID=A0A4Z2DTV0_SCHJA|nr:G2/mitotic-specific cyclin-B1 isoform 1 [Schistosoma japonicum]